MAESFQNGVDMSIQLDNPHLFESIFELVDKGKNVLFRSLIIISLTSNLNYLEQVYDLIIVPVSICYEKQLDKAENFSIVKFLLKMFVRTFFSSKSHGQIRINFSQPFSLKVSQPI